MALKQLKTLLCGTALCGLMVADLLAQGGLGAPPGRMGGVRSGSGGRSPQPSGHIPTTVPPSNGAESNAPGLPPSVSPSPSGASRPVGNIVYPGTPGSSNHGSINSPGLPGSVGHTSILSPGLPGPYRPGSILTPGTPAVASPARPHPGGIYAGQDQRRDYPRGRRGSFGRHRNSVIVYPYVYYGYPYGYGSGGYAVETGTVSRTSSSASYVIEGHLDTTSARIPHSKVYEVGPGAADAPDAQEAGSLDSGEARAESASPQGDVFYLVALQGGLIYASSEHWLLGNTVHFVTLQGDHYVVSLEEIDLDLSVQLNRERGLKFVLEVREQGAGAPAGPDAIP